MTQKQLWEIILKIFGLYLFTEGVLLVPHVFGSIYSVSKFVERVPFDYFLAASSNIGFFIIYMLLMYLCLFQTWWVAKVLGLTNEDESNVVNLNIHRQVVLQVSLLVSCLIIIIRELPGTLYQLYEYIVLDIQTREHVDVSRLIREILSVIAASILIIFNRRIISWIESRRRDVGGN